ncbi:MAG TPA: DUF4836 family protein, partial [Chitinophagaceae bacterium]|nr:DUF4836 family protein [Chitinophagaceae bacterium]
MKHKFFSLFITVICWQSLAFSQNNPLLKYVPEDMKLVMSIDAKRVGSKIPAETFKQSFFYRKIMKDPNMPFGAFLSEPERSGIDLSAGILIAIKNERIEGMERPQPSFCIFIKLRDAEAFTALMKKMAGDGEDSKIEVYGTDRILVSDASVAVGWNNDVFVISNGYAREIQKSIMQNFSYIDSFPPDPKKMEQAKYELAKGQRDMLFTLLSPKTSNSFSPDPHFTEVMNSDADIKLWNGGSMNPIAENMLPFPGLLEKLAAFGGKNKTATINFENGRVLMQGRSFLEGAMADIYKKYPAEAQHMDLVKRLPPGTLMGFANLSFNQEMAGELLQRSGLMQIVDSLKEEIPFDLSLIPGVFKSNMMIAAVKTDITEDTDESISKMGGLQLIIAVPIADKAKFEKLKPEILKTWDSMNEDRKAIVMKQPKGLYARHSDDMLVLALSPRTADAFLQNTGTGEVPALVQQYSKYPMVATINFGQLLATLFANNRPGDTRDGMMTVMDKFDKIVVYGGLYENGSINSTMEFRFSDPNQNSLKQWFELITSMAGNNADRMSDYKDRYMESDTTVMVDSVKIELLDIKQEEKRPEPPPPPPPVKPTKKE